MKALEKNKTIVAAVIVFALVIFVYRSFFKIEIDDFYTDPSSAQNLGASLIQTRTKLESVTLDHAIFSGASYRMLEDFSVPIPAELVGRSNPFDELGED